MKRLKWAKAVIVPCAAGDSAFKCPTSVSLHNLKKPAEVLSNPCYSVTL